MKMCLDSCRNPENPLVSVGIPLFNHEKYIKECIESVISQDYKNIELIVIDDGSCDESVKVFEKLRRKCEERFERFEFRSRENLGATRTLNEAVEWSRGVYFCQLDSDDVLLPSKISTLVRILEEDKNAAGVFSGHYVIDKNGDVLIGYSNKSKNYIFKEIIFHEHKFATVGQLLRLDIVKAVGGYKNDCYIGDWYMWLALTKTGKILKNCPEILAKYRYHDSNSSSSKQKMIRARKQVLDYFSDSPFYKAAASKLCVWTAIDLSYYSKTEAIRNLLKSIILNRNIIFTRYFYLGVLGVFTPKWFARRSNFYLSKFSFPSA